MTDQEDRSNTSKMVRLFMDADRCHRAIVESRVDRLGIHRSQHLMLMYIAGQKNPPNQAAIARAFDVSQATVAVTLKKMENAGFVERVTDSCDSRTNVVRLTDLGRDTVGRTHELFEEIDNRMTEGLTDGEIQLLIKCLAKMKSNLKKMCGDPEQ